MTVLCPRLRTQLKGFVVAEGEWICDASHKRHTARAETHSSVRTEIEVVLEGNGLQEGSDDKDKDKNDSPSRIRNRVFQEEYNPFQYERTDELAHIVNELQKGGYHKRTAE